ncbi:MAG: Gfo/Idh/MocA family oxidoreductase [Oscillospiraceae bacterium]|jgi:predicted dehydrogenase|nr:Gfo/Idh/MocA family oxidoreductase [Oscillospiraceae bacterium]
MSMLNVCVVGLGPIGSLHCRCYSKIEGVHLAAVCDRIPERAQKAGETFGVPWYLDAQEMLEKHRPGLCSVATGGYEYSSDHFEPTIQALLAGANVLVEKPICNDMDKARVMVKTARERGLRLAVDLNHRFTPAALLAKRWQEEGRLGDLLFCNMALWIGKPGEFESPWFHLKALNPHSVDIMRYFMGDVAQVHCFAMKAPGRGIWSTASVNMRFENGAVGHLTSSYDLARGHPMERCEVAGTKGRFVLDDMWREAVLYPADDLTKQVYSNPVFGGYGTFDDTFQARIQSFVDEIVAGAPPEGIDGSGRQGLEASRVIHAAIRSLEEGRPVDVAEI